MSYFCHVTKGKPLGETNNRVTIETHLIHMVPKAITKNSGIMPFVQSISKRDITSLGLPVTRETPVNPEPTKSLRHSILMQSNGL